MKRAALQQTETYTHTLRAMGVNAQYDPALDIHSIARGPVVLASRPVDLSQLAKWRRAYRGKFCIVTPDTADQGRLITAGFRQIMTPATVAEIDLTRDVPLHPKARNALRRAKACELTTPHRPFDVVQDAWLFAADHQQQRQKRFRGYPHGIIRQWPKSQSRIFLARKDGVTLAAMVFLSHGQVATYQLGWSGNEGRRCNAHHLLMDAAVTYFLAKSCVRLDLGMVDSVNALGLARFKHRSGARLRRLGGTWAALPVMRS